MCLIWWRHPSYMVHLLRHACMHEWMNAFGQNSPCHAWGEICRFHTYCHATPPQKYIRGLRRGGAGQHTTKSFRFFVRVSFFYHVDCRILGWIGYNIRTIIVESMQVTTYISAIHARKTIEWYVRSRALLDHDITCYVFVLYGEIWNDK